MFLFLAALAAMAFSFAGALHPAGDSLAVFRFPIAVLILGLAFLLVRRWRKLAAGAALILALAAEPLSLRVDAGPGPGAVLLYQKNLLYNNPTRDAVLADIRALAPDIVTFQEVGWQADAFWAEISADYPSRLRCAGRLRSMAVLSDWHPVGDPPICLPDLGLAAIRVAGPAGPVWVSSVHLGWPWPRRQMEQVEALVPHLSALEGPVILGGDFNNVPWSHALRLIRTASRTERLGPIRRTFHLPQGWLKVSIDHVLVPGGRGRIETRPLFGSDHVGVLARFDL